MAIRFFFLEFDSTILQIRYEYPSVGHLRGSEYHCMPKFLKEFEALQFRIYHNLINFHKTYIFKKKNCFLQLS